MIEPYDPNCKQYARDMDYLDLFKDSAETREEYIIYNEGTYNSENGHFACDGCYITLGCPTKPEGWKCP